MSRRWSATRLASGGASGEIGAMIDLAIVIVTYNVRDLLRGCLRAVQRSDTSLHLAVWVVDSGSTDSTSEMIRDEFPAVQLIQSENVAFSRGNKLALCR